MKVATYSEPASQTSHDPPVPLIILGTGGNCLDILDTVRDHPLGFSCVGFLDDDKAKWHQNVYGVPVLGPLNSAADYPDATFINGIGSPRTYWQKPKIIAQTGLSIERFATIIHPSATVSRSAEIGRGVVILQHVTIAAGSRVGHHVILLPSSIVSHHAVVGDYSAVAGAACISSSVRIAESCYVGSNSTIKEGVVIGQGSLLGAGCVVIRDVAPWTVVVGNPARYLRRSTDVSPPSS